jgi:ubiquinone/menaquinone biosynthesis C-methylase UbiE
MRQPTVTREQAQSFDRVAADYDRLGQLGAVTAGDSWLAELLPATGRRALDLGCGSGRHAGLLADHFERVDAIDVSGSMIELASARRPRPNVSYRQADLHDVDAPGQYDFVLSVLTLHHAPDLRDALSHIRALLAPCGRAVVMDVYPAESALRPPERSLRWMIHRVLPLRPRMHAMAALRLGVNLVRHRPSEAWEIYRLSTRKAWLDHLGSDRFFSREELERCCEELFPGYRLDLLGRPRVALIWDAPHGTE